MNSKRAVKLAAFVAVVGLLAVPSFGAVFVSVTIAPPVIPVYSQPICPGPDFMWMPGYWAYGPEGYFWVPGTWVLAPDPGLLWTPGYWGFANGLYVWHAGYWGPHVGFYGGVDYGFGYFGAGFVGGMWSGGHFRYNTAVMHVDPAVVHNTYADRTVIRNPVSRAAFNGPGGITARPTTAEATAARENHIAPTAVQSAHEQTAAANRANFASANHGRPATLATSRPTAGVAGRPAPTATNRPVQSRTPAPAPSAAPNRAASRPEQSRPAAAANHAPTVNRPATVNRPQVNHANPLQPPAAQNRPAPVRQQEPPNRAAQPNHAVQSNNAAPPRGPAQRSLEPAAPPAAANRPGPAAHAAPPTHQQAAGRPAQQPNAPGKHEERR